MKRRATFVNALQNHFTKSKDFLDNLVENEKKTEELFSVQTGSKLQSMQDMFITMQWNDIKMDMQLPQVDVISKFVDPTEPKEKEKEIDGFLLLSYTGRDAESLQKENDRLRQDLLNLTNKNTDNSSLLKENANLLQQVESAKSSYREEMDKMQNHLTALEDNLKEEKNKHNNEIQDMQTKLEEARASRSGVVADQAKHLEEQLKEANKKANHYIQAMTILRQQLAEEESKEEGLKTRLSVVEAENEGYKSQIKEIDTSIQKVNELTDSVAALQTLKENEGKKMIAYKKQIAELYRPQTTEPLSECPFCFKLGTKMDLMVHMDRMHKQ